MLNNAILNKYNILLKNLKTDEDTSAKKINQIIRTSLHTFCKSHKNPAIWCLGKHTRMLMADFMNEMKNVKIIIDSSKNNLENTGFQIITPGQIETYDIDGIIISSYVYKDEIKEELQKKHKAVEYLDLYEQLASQGILLKSSYFSRVHPYSKYQVINELQQLYKNAETIKLKIKYLKEIIKKYILIKDFQSAIRYAKLLVSLSEDKENRILLQELEEICHMVEKQVSKISSGNVVMLCIDGLRRQDLLNGKLPKLLSWTERNGYFFDHAYSSSTSTYESLLPVYSSNHDLKTKYYEKSILSETECPFIKKACKQNRKIFFYTDTDPYIDCKKIRMNGLSQTMSEKLWDFIHDAIDENHGLFYIHILYESHYSYVNPYTENTLVADGSNIMFDFLETKGGKLRTDYISQQKDALQYIDNLLFPFLNLLPCRTVLYADHGNILMDKSDSLERLDPLKYSCHKDLLEVPIIIKCPELPPQRDPRLISLMELNTILCSLLEKKPYNYQDVPYIKAQRSRIYNPDFQYLYKKYGKEQELQAFELFIFPDGVQLLIYENGDVKVLSPPKNVPVNLTQRIELILSDITVCNKLNTAYFEKNYGGL